VKTLREEDSPTEIPPGIRSFVNALEKQLQTNAIVVKTHKLQPEMDATGALEEYSVGKAQYRTYVLIIPRSL